MSWCVRIGLFQTICQYGCWSSGTLQLCSWLWLARSRASWGRIELSMPFQCGGMQGCQVLLNFSICYWNCTFLTEIFLKFCQNTEICLNFPVVSAQKYWNLCEITQKYWNYYNLLLKWVPRGWQPWNDMKWKIDLCSCFLLKELVCKRLMMLS